METAFLHLASFVSSFCFSSSFFYGFRCSFYTCVISMLSDKQQIWSTPNALPTDRLQMHCPSRLCVSQKRFNTSFGNLKHKQMACDLHLAEHSTVAIYLNNCRFNSNTNKRGEKNENMTTQEDRTLEKREEPVENVMSLAC